MSPRPATAKAGSRAKGAAYLDKTTLVRVAAEVADRDGWPNLTLSQVAKEVGRHVTSLYAHVDSLDALRREVALLALEELADAVWRAALGRSREEALVAIASVERAYFREHPGRNAAMITYIRADDEQLRTSGLRLAEPIRATFRSFGLDEEQVVIAHALFSSALRGLVLAEITNTYRFANLDEAHAELIGLFVAGLSTGTWPGAGDGSAPPESSGPDELLQTKASRPSARPR